MPARAAPEIAAPVRFHPEAGMRLQPHSGHFNFQPLWCKTELLRRTYRECEILCLPLVCEITRASSSGLS